MSLVVAPTESQVFTALRSFLLGLGLAYSAPQATAAEVVKGQANRVAEPQGADFVVMTPIRRERLSTNVDTYTDPYPLPGGVGAALQPTRVVVQLDVHGPNSGDNAQVIATMLRDPYAFDAFAASGFDVVPLYADDPRQIPFIDAEKQYEDRWIVDAHLQANEVVTGAPVQFYASAVVNLVEVEATYAP